MINKLLPFLLLVGLSTSHATITITEIDVGNASPNKVLSDPGGIEDTIGALLSIPQDVMFLGERTGFNKSTGSWLNAECIQDHVTLTFFDKSGGSYENGEEAGHARYENDGLGDLQIYYIAVAGGGGTKHKVYSNQDATQVLEFPDFYEFLTSTTNGGGNLSEFSHLYFYGTKLSAVPEPSTVISLMTIGLIGFVTFRRRRARKQS